MRAIEFIIERQSAKDILKYVKSIHHDFHIDDIILTHPYWELKRVPLHKLHVPDPESGEDLDDPYNRVQMIDMYHVDDITQRDIENKPVVVDTDGYIIDGNHRALAARLSGMKDIPAYVPVKVNETNFGGQEVEGNAYTQFTEKFPNLSTLAYFIPGFRQALMVADMASAIQMYNQGIAKIEQQYPKTTIQQVQQKVGDEIEDLAPIDSVNENFADGKKPGRRGLAKRVGVNCKQSVSKLRSIAAHSSGERQRMAHWCANMKSGRNK